MTGVQTCALPILDKIEFRHILITTILFSLVISVVRIAGNHTINDDGIIYLISAGYISEGNWGAAIDTFPWPFFPALIAIFSKATTLSIEISAHIVVTLSYLLLAVYFLLLLKEMGATKRILIFAAITLLIFPKLNDYRVMIIRDPLFWALIVASFYHYYSFISKQKWTSAIIFVVASILSILARVEGVVYLVVLTCSLLYLIEGQKNKYLGFIKIISVLVPVSLAAIYILSVYDYGYSNYIGIAEQLFNALPSMHKSFQERTGVVQSLILSKYLHAYAWFALLGAMIFTYLSKLILTIPFVNLVGLLYAFKRRILIPDKKKWAVVVIFAGTSLLATIYAFITQYFIITRHLMVFNLLLSLIAAYGFDAIYQNVWKKRKNIVYKDYLKIFFVLALFITALDGLLSTGTSKIYIKEAGYWLQNENNRNLPVYSNSNKFLYYAGWYSQNGWEAERNIRDIVKIRSKKMVAAYFAVNMKKKQAVDYTKFINTLGKPVKTFVNNKGDKLLIYKTIS